MLSQVAIFLLLNSSARAAVDPEVSEDLQKNDWPALVLLLKPKQGQNFEQDLILAHAFLSLERRTEALKTLNALVLQKKDDRVTKLIDVASTQFFNQETATLYYEAVRILSRILTGDKTDDKVVMLTPAQKITQAATEAKERLDQALLKEPDHPLILLRLIQVELLLGLKEPLQEHLKLALDLNPSQNELSVFQAKILFDQGQEKEAYKILFPLKAYLYENEQTLLWYLEVLLKLEKSAEITAAKNKILKEHPLWLRLTYWFHKNLQLSASEQKFAKPSDKYAAIYAEEMKKTQYFWIGY